MQTPFIILVYSLSYGVVGRDGWKVLKAQKHINFNSDNNNVSNNLIIITNHCCCMWNNYNYTEFIQSAISYRMQFHSVFFSFHFSPARKMQTFPSCENSGKSHLLLNFLHLCNSRYTHNNILYKPFTMSMSREP
jgi:hypothetical protein